MNTRIACSHLVYFTHLEGLRGLAKAVLATGILSQAETSLLACEQ